MLDGVKQLSGTVWQQYVNQLLSVHYALHGDAYQAVPDIGGDHGLEGFSLSGHGYQAYSDQDSKTFKERSDRQKKKITTDLKKLVKHADWWKQTLQDVQLRRWSLLVPKLEDNGVVKHVRMKATELRNHKLSFVAADFQGTVYTAEDFPKAKAHLDDPSLARCTISTPSVTDAHLEELESTASDFTANVHRKLRKLIPNDDSKAREAEKDFLRWHLRCANFLEELRRQFPLYWEQLDRLASTTADAVSTEGHFDSAPAQQRLKNVRADFEAKLRNLPPFIGEGDMPTLAFGHIARWLGECQLDFPEGANDA